MGNIWNVKQKTTEAVATSAQQGQRYHEVETDVTTEQEGGLLKTYIGCSKHREDSTHHGRFKTMEEFGVNDLSDSKLSRDKKEGIVQWVKEISTSVVRITGRYISPDRPDTWEDGHPYFFSDCRGQSTNIVGSGWVPALVGGPYYCSDEYHGCREESGASGETCYSFDLFTARHVLFDKSEMDKCQIDFFDDEPTGTSKVIVHGHDVSAKLWESDTEMDYCWFKCRIHDHALKGKMQGKKAPTWLTPKVIEKNLPTIVVSHPHGKIRYISVGEQQGAHDEGFKGCLYNTPTCTGSSGGLVLLGGRSQSCYGVTRGIHGGMKSAGDSKKLGYSVFSWD